MLARRKIHVGLLYCVYQWHTACVFVSLAVAMFSFLDFKIWCPVLCSVQSSPDRYESVSSVTNPWAFDNKCTQVSPCQHPSQFLQLTVFVWVICLRSSLARRSCAFGRTPVRGVGAGWRLTLFNNLKSTASLSAVGSRVRGPVMVQLARHHVSF